jgi:hypothetical protein
MGETNQTRSESNRWLDGYLGAVTGLIATSLALKLAFVAETLGSDDLRYFEFAGKIARLQAFSQLDHAGGRLTFLALVGVPAAWAGQVVVSAIVNVFIALATECAVAYYLWTRTGRQAALLGTLFLTFNGLVLTFTGTFVPDTLLAFLFLCSALLAFRVIEDDARPLLTSLLLGMVIGFAYSTKETGILLLPPVLFCILVIRPGHFVERLLLVLLVTLGFALIWIVECGALWLLTGKFFYRYDAIVHAHNAAIPAAESVTEFVRHAYWNAFNVVKDWDFLLLPALLAVGTFALLIWRGGSASTLALIIAFCGSYLIGGTSSLTRLVNLPFTERYAVPLLPLVALAIGMAVAPYLRSYHLRVGALALLSASAFVSLYGSLDRVGNRFFEPYLSGAAVAVRSLDLSDDRPLFVDVRTLGGLRHLVDASALKNVRLIADGQRYEPGLLLLHPDYCCPSKEQSEQLASAQVVLDIRIDQRMLKRLFPGAAARQPKYPVRVYLVGG